MFIKTGDKVRVIAGKDKGKEGNVKKILLPKTVLSLKALTR